MFRKWLGPIEHLVAVATAIFVGRHVILHVRLRPRAASCRPCSIGTGYGLKYGNGPTTSIAPGSPPKPPMRATNAGAQPSALRAKRRFPGASAYG